MTFRFTLINDAAVLKQHKSSILELFSSCFSRNLDPDLWEWAYCKNPMGNPIVSLCHASGKLVGHYAVTPSNLTWKGTPLPACMAMTAMVDASHRKCGLFVEQAQRVQEYAKTSGVSILFAFPNVNSAPGFRNKLGWTLEEPDFVAAITMKRLASSPRFRSILDDSSLVRLGIYDPVYLKWRLSKPGNTYHNFSSHIIKEYGSQKDLVAIQSLPSQGHDDTTVYNILLDAEVTDLKEHQMFPYQFGFKALDDRFNNLKFKKDMLLSDVF